MALKHGYVPTWTAHTPQLTQHTCAAHTHLSSHHTRRVVRGGEVAGGKPHHNRVHSMAAEPATTPHNVGHTTQGTKCTVTMPPRKAMRAVCVRQPRNEN